MEATKALLCSPHGMTRATARALCLRALQRSAWTATDRIEPHLTCCPQALYPNLQARNQPTMAVALEAPLQLSWRLLDQAVINWADNLSNKNAINRNRPSGSKLYTAERGEETHTQE